jgi:putative ABC transport system permease protein
LGLLLAGSAAGVFLSLGKSLPRIEEISLDWRIVLYSLICSVVATLLCGIFPAIRGTRGDLAGSARGGRGTVSGGSGVQLSLVGVQVALAVTLLAGAALLVRSFQQLGRVSPGFEPEHILTFQLSTSWAETGGYKAAKQRVDRIMEGLHAVPGVEAATAVMSLPGVPSEYQIEFKVDEGRAETEPKVIAQARSVTPSYFAAMRIPLLAGEMCREEGKVTTTMVNRTFANTYFAGGSPIGRHLSQPGNIYVPASEVRGIVGDAREAGLDREPAPTVYWCFSFAQPGTHYLARTHAEPRAMVETIRRAMREIEPRRSVYDVTPLVEKISDGYATNRLRTVLLVFFACSAILLACVGLYGTISYVVHVRKREVGLRLALGALPGRIIAQFLSQGLLVAALGCAAGIALALVFTRLLAGMLYGVSATDPATLTTVVMIVLAVSALASLAPAMRASRVDPMQVLRED